MNKLCGLLCLGLSAGLSVSSAHAENYGFEITPYAGYRTGGSFEDANDGSSREVDSGSSYGLFLHFRQIEGAYYEFNYSKQTTELQGADPFDLSIEYFQIGGSLEFAQPEDIFRPYIALTVGATLFSPERGELEDKTAASMSLGVGAKIPVAKHVAIRLEARAYASFLNADSDIFCAGTSDTAACAIRVSSDYFVQGRGLLGVTVGF